MTDIGNEFNKVKEKGVITTETKEKKNIMEFKVVSNLNTIKDDRQEYRVWTDKLKNAVDQVNADLREVLEKIETTHWGKGEESEWLEKQSEVKEEVIVEDAEWF